jgi:Asp-tRNA(Asn)/Glu-tRNA(Gln) amidotransferase A subunit family amidase
MSGLNRLSATSLARKLATREITAEALIADCIERIRERSRTFARGHFSIRCSDAARA